jgi:hypothetical protein
LVLTLLRIGHEDFNLLIKGVYLSLLKVFHSLSAPCVSEGVFGLVGVLSVIDGIFLDYDAVDDSYGT